MYTMSHTLDGCARVCAYLWEGYFVNDATVVASD